MKTDPSKDIPIIFSKTMVLALLAGRKSMTRRLAWDEDGKEVSLGEGDDLEQKGWRLRSLGTTSCVAHRPSPWQRVKPGDRLWVKEDLQRFNREPRATAQYVADTTAVPHRGLVEGWCDGRAYWNWKVKYLTGRFCPRWASRLTLIVTATKIERVQEIGTQDAYREGMDFESFKNGTAKGLDAKSSFAILWNKLHGADAWDANPEVVAITFAVHKQNIDALPKAEAA